MKFLMDLDKKLVLSFPFLKFWTEFVSQHCLFFGESSTMKKQNKIFSQNEQHQNVEIIADSKCQRSSKLEKVTQIH